MSAARFARMATAGGFVVDQQVDRWGDEQQFSVAYRDVITVGTKTWRRRSSGMLLLVRGFMALLLRLGAGLGTSPGLGSFPHYLIYEIISRS